MKNLDLFSKRIFTVSLSLSMLLLSAAIFVYSIKPAHAKPGFLGPNPFPNPTVASENYCSLGIYNGYVYYFWVSGSTVEFSKIKLDVAKDFTDNYK